MKTFLKMAGVLVLLSLPMKASESERVAYICVSKNAKVYHLDKDCKGLNRCTHEVRTIKLKDAMRIRRSCRICA